MTTYQKAVLIIADSLNKHKNAHPIDAAGYAVAALLEKRIMPTTMVASPDMFKRFHAHCRFLGKETGYGYKYWYNLAVEHAERLEDWPCKVLARTVDIDGTMVTVDVSVPESTTKANNRQLLTAYQIIEEGAKEHGVALPENWSEE